MRIQNLARHLRRSFLIKSLTAISIFAKNAILVSEMVLNTPVYVNGESFTHQLLLKNCF